ncbi:hypothetical protein ABZ864_40895 [Streptomyces sp. NPDC047082]|uniref:hypothetical protein n=1 Tax=Streptomyces sp. NPDC047082 TaxID=3155259 RepID=UPI00340A91ED
MRRGSAPVRTGLCAAAGATAGTGVFLMGLDPVESVSFGMNVAATAAAFWTPAKATPVQARTETV